MQTNVSYVFDDTSRKLLRIIAHFRAKNKRMLTIREQGRLSGRWPADIIKGFKSLAADNYITWMQPRQSRQLYYWRGGNGMHHKIQRCRELHRLRGTAVLLITGFTIRRT
ncbi:hypothetical protein R70331_14300 [Paenibacillus sp. FSL R7-0331]|nr:hypothetical protein R70331_14300 [Paenibacillus sp. FSL R7-0331]